MRDPFLFVSFNNRKPFKMTRIVLPSCPITPNGRAKIARSLNKLALQLQLVKRVRFALQYDSFVLISGSLEKVEIIRFS